jgi:hypothetical protein
MDYNNYKIKYLSLKNELEGGLFLSQSAMGALASGVGSLGKGLVKGLAASTESVANVASRKGDCAFSNVGQNEIKTAFEQIYNNFQKILLVIFAKIYNSDTELILSTGKISYNTIALSKQNRLKNNITLVLESLRYIIENNYILKERSVGSFQSIDDIKTVANFLEKITKDKEKLKILKINLELILNKIDCLCKNSSDFLESSQLTTLEKCFNININNDNDNKFKKIFFELKNEEEDKFKTILDNKLEINLERKEKEKILRKELKEQFKKEEEEKNKKV